jgi:uncharacterized protein YcfJ
MKNRLLARSILALSMSMFVAGCASADHGYRRHHHHDQIYATYDAYNYGDYGRVMAARPIYRQVAIEVPRESCRVRTVARESRNGDSFAGTVVGGLVGAAIGHEIGNGRGAATAVGGLIGASIGNDAGSSRTVRYRDEEICRTSYRTEYENRIVGYDVSYKYNGRIYQTRTDRHPGDRIPISVAVRSRGY